MSQIEEGTSLLAERAMDQGRVVEFVYDGLLRRVEVHAVGVSRAGKPCIRGYQIGGDSMSEVPAWKLFSTHKIHSFKMLTEISDAPREGYQKDDKIGRAHVSTPVTNAQIVCRLLLDKKTKTKLTNTHT